MITRSRASYVSALDPSCPVKSEANMASAIVCGCGRCWTFGGDGLSEPISCRLLCVPGLPTVRQMCGEQFGEVDGAAIGELVELGAAGEPVRQHDAVAGRGAYRRQQRYLGYRNRQVVVAAFDPEVPGQTAAAADRLHVRAGVGEQCGFGLPAHHRMLVAVRLGDRVNASE